MCSALREFPCPVLQLLGVARSKVLMALKVKVIRIAKVTKTAVRLRCAFAEYSGETELV